jgi:hypothetical protein
MRETVKGIGFILIALATLGLILNEFIFEPSSARTIIIAAVDVTGLACLVYGRFWRRGNNTP